MEPLIAALLVIGAVVAALTAIFKLGSAVTKFIRKLNHLVDDIIGEEARDGVPARPGVMTRLEKIEHELKPNSGKSLRDAVDKTMVKADAAIAAAELNHEALQELLLKQKDQTTN